MGTLSVDKLVKTSAGAAEFTLPATDGTAGQVMQTDGAGQLSIAALATDSVTATQIATDAVTATEIAANAVTTTEIIDNAVTGAKIAMGSDATGDLLYYNGTDYVRLAAGTSAQVLTSAGVAAPTWSAATGADTSLSNLVAAGADKIVKAWVCFDGDPLAIRDSFNVSSITDVGVGTWTVNWDTDFANASYAVVAGGSASSGGGDYMQTQNTNTLVGSTPVYAYKSGGGSTWDPNYVSIVAIGDQ